MSGVSSSLQGVRHGASGEEEADGWGVGDFAGAVGARREYRARGARGVEPGESDGVHHRAKADADHGAEGGGRGGGVGKGGGSGGGWGRGGGGRCWGGWR